MKVDESQSTNMTQWAFDFEGGMNAHSWFVRVIVWDEDEISSGETLNHFSRVEISEANQGVIFQHSLENSLLIFVGSVL